MKSTISIALLIFILLSCHHNSASSKILQPNEYKNIIIYAKTHNILKLIVSFKINELDKKNDKEKAKIIHEQSYQILKSLPSSKLVRQYDTIPAMVIIIDSKDLNKLILINNISGIQLDTLAKPIKNIIRK